MKKTFDKSLAALFCFFCLLSCGLVEPYRDLEIGIITDHQYLDVALYEMPDSVKIFHGHYDTYFLHDGAIHLSKIPDGEYWIIVKEEGTKAPYAGERFKYTGKKSITLEL